MRLRIETRIPADLVSPDAIRASLDNAVLDLEGRAELMGRPMNWNGFKTLIRRKRNGDIHVLAWVRELS